MATTEKADLVLESLAREMLGSNPVIKHEWRPMKSRVSGTAELGVEERNTAL